MAQRVDALGRCRRLMWPPVHAPRRPLTQRFPHGEYQEPSLGPTWSGIRHYVDGVVGIATRTGSQGAEYDAVATDTAGFVEQRTPKPRVDVTCLLRLQGGNLIVESGDGEQEGGDSASLVLAEALVETEVCQVRDEEGIFLPPPEVSADGVGMREETANFVKRS